MTEPCPQVFSVNGSIIFDVNDSIICSGLHFWRQWFNNLQRTALLTSLVQYDRILGQQQLFMVNYACGFNQSETGKYFEWIIMVIIGRGWAKYRDLRDTDKSRYFAITEFNNCFIIRSPNLSSYCILITFWQFWEAFCHFSPENVVPIAHEQNIICSKTNLVPRTSFPLTSGRKTRALGASVLK